MGEKEDQQAVRDLLAGLTGNDVRALAMEALRRWRRTSRELEFSIHGDLGRALVPLLTERRGTPATPDLIHRLKEPFLSAQGEAWMQLMVDFLAWTVRAGLTFPLYDATGYPSRYRLTAAGGRMLEGTDDHPLLPGFLDRIVKRCPGLPDEVSVHLVDARACLEHGLGRPAISLMGLAYEVAEDGALDYLVDAGKLRVRNGARVAEKIAAVKVALPTLLTDLEHRGAAAAAWDFADHLRARRNHASHPKAYPDFSDLTEVHEFIVSAGRHLPGLWSVRRT